MRALPHGTVADALATVRTSGALVTTKDEMMRAIRGHPNRGLRDLSSTMARMSDSLGPFGPGFFGRALEENNRRYLPRTSA